jgi:hypothetical protein
MPFPPDNPLPRKKITLFGTKVIAAFFITSVLLPLTAFAQKKPNILVIFGDDIGQTNISRYSHGLVGYMTPNIDRIGGDGMTFTDYYAENSCTAGRATFITGQSAMRTGLSAHRERRSGCKSATLRSRRRLSLSVMPPGNSAKTTSVTATSISPPITF